MTWSKRKPVVVNTSTISDIPRDKVTCRITLGRWCCLPKRPRSHKPWMWVHVDRLSTDMRQTPPVHHHGYHPDEAVNIHSPWSCGANANPALGSHHPALTRASLEKAGKGTNSSERSVQAMEPHSDALYGHCLPSCWTLLCWSISLCALKLQGAKTMWAS